MECRASLYPGLQRVQGGSKRGQIVLTCRGLIIYYEGPVILEGGGGGQFKTCPFFGE